MDPSAVQISSKIWILIDLYDFIDRLFVYLEDSLIS